MTNKEKRRNVIHRGVAIIAILAVAFFILLLASIVENEANTPSLDSRAIKYVKQEFKELYRDCSPDKLEELRQRTKQTVYGHVIFLEPQTDDDEILAIAYWYSKYHRRDYFVTLHKNGEIAVANAKPKRP